MNGNSSKSISQYLLAFLFGAVQLSLFFGVFSISPSDKPTSAWNIVVTCLILQFAILFAVLYYHFRMSNLKGDSLKALVARGNFGLVLLSSISAIASLMSTVFLDLPILLPFSIIIVFSSTFIIPISFRALTIKRPLILIIVAGFFCSLILGSILLSIAPKRPRLSEESVYLKTMRSFPTLENKLTYCKSLHYYADACLSNAYYEENKNVLDPELCRKISNQPWRYTCIMDIVMKTHNPELCLEISHSGYRSQCVIVLAQETRNSDYCDYTVDKDKKLCVFRVQEAIEFDSHNN